MQAISTIELKDPGRPREQALIGCSPGCDIRILNDPHVLDRHAMVIRDSPGQFRIKALVSGGRTRVLRGLSEHHLGAGQHMLLVRGDTILVGRTRLAWSGTFA